MKAKLYLIVLGIIIISNISFADIIPCGGENGEFWAQSSTQTIRWDTSNFSGNVNIYLWNMTSATFTTIAADLAYSLGEYSWEISENHPTGNYFRIKVIQSDDSTKYEMSDTFIPIYEGGSPFNGVYENKIGYNIISIYPNPTSQVSIIKYQLSIPFHVSIKIIDIFGEEINTIVNKNHEAGECKLEYDVSSLPTGTYFCVIYAGLKVDAVKFIKE